MQGMAKKMDITPQVIDTVLLKGYIIGVIMEKHMEKKMAGLYRDNGHGTYYILIIRVIAPLKCNVTGGQSAP